LKQYQRLSLKTLLGSSLFDIPLNVQPLIAIPFQSETIPETNPKTSHPKPNVDAISKTVAEDLVRLFSQTTGIRDIPLAVQPLTYIPPQTETQNETPSETSQLDVLPRPNPITSTRNLFSLKSRKLP